LNSSATLALHRGLFTLDVVRTSYETRNVGIPGWTDGELWYGWQTPHFDRDAAELLADTLEQVGLPLRYDPEADAYISLPENYDPDEGDPRPR
jgi:hypothetical protein